MNFSEKLKRVRKLMNLSQENLARELKVSFATINRLESAKTLPNYNTLMKFEEYCQKNKNLLGDNWEIYVK